MNIWIVVQLMVNLFFLAGILFLLINRKQTQKDDQKFSKGLQILQNKISVLEDLSDQTDDQVRALTKLLEDKYREIQALLVDSDLQIQKMEEIAKNIWSQVQSTEGLRPSSETQSMNKYVKAAQLANSGKTIEEVVREVDITRGEAELIVAMNKDHLTFNQNSLPLWVQPEKAAAPQASTVGAEFLKALKQTPVAPVTPVVPAMPVTTATPAPAAAQTRASAPTPAQQKGPNIRPFEFKRIDLG